MKGIRVTLIGRDGCHLCDEASAVIEGVLEGFTDVFLEHRNLSEDPVWAKDYAEKIPVILINGVEHAYWRVNPERFGESLAQQGAVSR